MYFSHAIELEKDNYTLYSSRSAAYLKQGDPDRALIDANVCIRLKPLYDKGYGRKGAALHYLKKYDHAIAVYKEGLKVAPAAEHLTLGLAAAKRAKLDSSEAQKAARKMSATRRASISKAKKKKKCGNVSSYVQQTRMELELQKAAIEAQLKLIDELATMTDEEKLDLLFNSIDRDGDGTVDANELACALRKRNAEMSFSSSLENAIKTVACFDKDGDAKLDITEFSDFVDAMLVQLKLEFNEFAEFLVLQILFSEESPEEELAVELAKPDLSKEVRKHEALLDILEDKRMVQLFQLFDKDGSGELSFKEVAVGLYQLTQNMDESAKTTTDLLLMIGDDDKRTLKYEQFGRLIMGIVAAKGSTFDEIADDLTLAMTKHDTITKKDLAKLQVADTEYEQVAREIGKTSETGDKFIDPLGYRRLQKLFDLWDVDGDGTITHSELVVGLRKFQKAAGVVDDAEQHAKAMLKFDTNGDRRLNRQEFARAIVGYAKVSNVAVHDLIDFMVVTSVLHEDESVGYQKAYRQSFADEKSTNSKAVSTKCYEAEVTEAADPSDYSETEEFWD